MAVTQAQLEQLYLAYFGRPADFDGLVYYTSNPNITDIWQVAAAFSASPESQALYGSGFNASVINSIYQNLFNRDAEPAGLLYWSQQVASGALTAAGAAYAILLGAQNADATTVANKLQVATAFTNALNTAPEITGYTGNAAAAEARTWLHTVTSDPATLTAALAGVDAEVSAVVAVGGVTVTTTLTTGIDNLAGTGANDIFVGQIDGSTGGVTTYNSADQVDGAGGVNTLKVVNSNNTDVEINGNNAANIQKLVIVNTDSNLDTINVNGGSFTDMTLDYGSTLGGDADLYLEGLSNQASFTVQNVHHFNDDSIYRNDSGTWDDTSGTVSTSNTLKNIDLGPGSEDMFFYGYEYFTNATTINHTFNVSNVLDGSATAGGAGFEYEDNIESATDGSTINSTINVDNVKILGDYDEGAGVYVYGSNTVGTSTYNVMANISNTDILDFYYSAANSGTSDKIEYNVTNMTDDSSNTGYYSELWTAGFENITLNVWGDATTNFFGEDGGNGNDINVTINAQANFTVAAGAYDSGTPANNSYTGFGSGYGYTDNVGNVTLTIEGSGDVALGDLYMGDGGATDVITIDGSTATGAISFVLENDFNSIKLGSGDDSVELTAALAAGHVIDGGAGSDSIKFGNTGGTLIAQDYALINGVIVNFEKMEFENGVTLDASKMTGGNYTAFTFDQTSTITNVAAGQSLTAKADLTATAAGYDATTTPITYAGALSVTAKGNGSTLTLNADSATVNVAAKTADIAVTVAGDLKTSLTVNTTMGATGTTSTDNNTFAHVTVGPVTTTGPDLGALKAVTLTGVGYATIDNSNGGTATKLATVDASALGGVGTVGTTKGFVEGGLTYTANNAVTETVSLGAGQDYVSDNGSTYGKMDTITGFDAVQESATAGKSVVDTLVFDGLTLDGSSANTGIEKITIDTSIYTTLALAFTHAADVSNTDAKVVQFTYAGNTYLFGDSNANGLLDNADYAIKLSGTVDLTTKFGTHV